MSGLIHIQASDADKIELEVWVKLALSKPSMYVAFRQCFTEHVHTRYTLIGLGGIPWLILVFAGYAELSRVMRKQTFWFPTWSDTNQIVQLQKMARGLKFLIYKVEGLYYLCSENKGADQLRGYREADLRLCFRICKMLVFSWSGSLLKIFCCSAKDNGNYWTVKKVVKCKWPT